jgi:hypothetical protein
MPADPVRPRPADTALVLLPPYCLEDQEGLTAFGDQASDLDFLVTGAGFEPATSGCITPAERIRWVRIALQGINRSNHCGHPTGVS